MNPKVIHAEKDFLILNKPAGLLMHGLPNKTVEEPTLADWLLENYPEVKKVGDAPEMRPGIVHRLDRDTSGIILVARTQKFFEYAKDLFQKHAVKKTYLALTRGHLERERNIIERPIGVKQGTTARSVRSNKMVKDATTEYHVLERLIRREDAEEGSRFKSSLLEVWPRTGRTHQIRVHLTAIGHPILGDPIYGPKQKLNWVTRLMLHSNKLEFENKNGKKLAFEAEPDKEFKNILREAGSLL